MRLSISAIRRTGLAVAVAAALAGLTACGGEVARTATGEEGAAEGSAAGQNALLLSREDVLTVSSNSLASGPSITGSVQPERRADLRAEVSAVVLQALKENGDLVRRGDLLVRLDDTAIRDTLTSADASERAAIQAFEQAERQFQRVTQLRKSGLVSAQELEDAETRRNTAQSEREAAHTRVVSARQQLQRTQVRAPFDGIVSDRKVSGGDTAQIGKELLKVIDPQSLRFEGLVSADNIGEVQTGQRVVFRVHGFAEKEFLGTVTRVNPSANTTTRQVEVLVNFAEGTQQPGVAGLYAEGRIETTRRAALTIPETALVREGDNAFAWRVKNGVLQKVSVRLGDRDPRSGQVALESGLTEGDDLLRYPNTALHDGQTVQMAARAGTSQVLKEEALATASGN